MCQLKDLSQIIEVRRYFMTSISAVVLFTECFAGMITAFNIPSCAFLLMRHGEKTRFCSRLRKNDGRCMVVRVRHDCIVPTQETKAETNQTGRKPLDLFFGTQLPPPYTCLSARDTTPAAPAFGRVLVRVRVSGQMRATTKRTKWRATPTPKLVTMPAPIPYRDTA